MEEKLDGLNEAMERMASQNGGSTTDDGGSTDIQDPGELAKQVNIYIEKLEADLMEVEGDTRTYAHLLLLVNLLHNHLFDPFSYVKTP